MRVQARLFWGSLILACAFFAFCVIDALRLTRTYGLEAEVDPLARLMLNVSPLLFFVIPPAIIFVPWLCRKFINEEYGLVVAGIFLGVMVMDAFAHIFLLF